MEEERASGHRPEEQKGRQAESGLQGGSPFAVGGDVPPIRRAGPVGIKQHQSFDQGEFSGLLHGRAAAHEIA